MYFDHPVHQYETHVFMNVLENLVLLTSLFIINCVPIFEACGLRFVFRSLVSSLWVKSTVCMTLIWTLAVATLLILGLVSMKY